MKRKILSLLLALCMLLGFLPDGLLTKADAAPSTTEANVTALFNARSYGQHPRILANTEDFARIREQVRTDPYMRILYERIYDYCLTQLSEPVVKYEIPDGVRLLGVSRTASQRIVWLAMAYQISGEARFAQRAIKEMLAVSAFSDWHPAHYLDTAQMAYGVGLGYDWLYHEMTASQRNTVCTAMYNYALQTYSGKSFQNGSNNWNPWCHGGIAIAAAAIFESYPSACAKFFASSVTNIQKALAVLTPLGAYPEGPGYFCVASEFMALFMDTLATVLGTDFGLSDLDGVKESGKYLLAVNGNVSAFNFGDGSGSLQDSSALHWYAKRYNMPELSVYQRERQYTGIQAVDVLGLVWYDPELVGDMTEEDIQLDYLMYSDAYESVASFRSPAGDARQIYTAIKSGYNSTGHSDMDIGTFVMEAMGVRFIEDMGSDNYNLSGYGTSSNGIYAEDGKRWTYYRKRAEGQNTLVLNPSTKGGQDAVAKAQIVGYGSTYDGGYAAVNMLDAYDSYTATSAKRALALFDNRSRVLVRDEITCSSASTLYWFAHTRAEISISVDKKSAVLTSDGKQLLVQIAEPSNATFTAMDAQPLSTSPKPSGENSREGWRKLSICLKNIKSANITVVFTPLLEEGDGNKALPAATLANLPQLLHSYESGTQLLANEQGVYEIHDANELMLFADMVNNGTDFQGKTVKLLSDIDLQGHSFVPIGGVNGTNYFRGTFDGGNHVVRNLCIFRPGSASTGF
ncbi:MAG: heparinase II/III family protein, partial [Oscillospiraceae bacterium]|nr:heparinase II/III family protein [Oscillospiraceae bacterium]